MAVTARPGRRRIAAAPPTTHNAAMAGWIVSIAAALLIGLATPAWGQDEADGPGEISGEPRMGWSPGAPSVGLATLGGVVGIPIILGALPALAAPPVHHTVSFGVLYVLFGARILE